MRISVFDIGGTFIKHGLFDGSTLSEVRQIPTEAHLGTDHLIAALADILRQELQEAPLDGIGISTRGQVDTEAGRIIYDPPEVIPGYSGTCLRQKLQSALGCDCQPSDRCGKRRQLCSPGRKPDRCRERVCRLYLHCFRYGYRRCDPFRSSGVSWCRLLGRRIRYDAVSRWLRRFHVL